MALYLILHKVRGRPALDIAELCPEMETPSDPGPWWIIPTSGHRAHPYLYLSLDLLAPNDTPQEPVSKWVLEPAPNDVPDHYEVRLPRNAWHRLGSEPPPPRPRRTEPRRDITADDLDV